MKVLKCYRLDERLCSLVSFMASRFNTSNTEIISRAIAYYYEDVIDKDYLPF